jgi:hypothetical protein
MRRGMTEVAFWRYALILLNVGGMYRVRARNARIRAMRAITKTPLFSQLHTTTTRWV